MDALYSVLAKLHKRLSWISTDYSVPWRKYVLGFSWGNALFEVYLTLRQYPYFSKPAPPAILAKHFTDEEFKKSQAYGRDKAKFSIISTLYGQIIETAIIYYGGYAWAWDIAGVLLGKLGYGSEYEIPQSIIFAAVLGLMNAIPMLPLEIYSTFVIEERHGFNKTTPLLFLTDLIKGWGVAFAIGAPFLSTFLGIVRWAGDRLAPWLMGFLFTFQMLMIFIYPTWIQPLFNKLSPLSEGSLRDRILALAAGLKFPLKHLYEIDGSKRSSHSNAYFFGLPWNKHIVIFDTLIKQSSEEEVEAVLAHELGHWYYMHPTKMLVVSQLNIFSILAVFPPFLNSRPLLESFDFPSKVASKPPILVSFFLFQMLLTPTQAVVAMVMNAISRKFEWEADAFACELHEKLPGQAGVETMGDRLGRALVTLYVKNAGSVWVDWLYSAIHHSHPTLTERLEALDKLKAKKSKSQKKDL